MKYIQLDTNSNKLNLPKNSIDLVTFNMQIHHCKEKAALLTDVRRLLKPGGHLFFKEHDVEEMDE